MLIDGEAALLRGGKMSRVGGRGRGPREDGERGEVVAARPPRGSACEAGHAEGAME